jgi:hypothetical protein
MLTSARDSGGPTARTLWRWGLAVLALHVVVLMSMAGSSVWLWDGPQTLRVGPVQTRWLVPQPVPQPASLASPPKPSTPQPRLATEPKPAEAAPQPLAEAGLSPEGASQGAETLA